jgi:cell division septal protein FtsQ
MKRTLPLASSKTILVVVLTVTIFGAGSYLLGWSNLLTVKQVEISGAPTKSAELEITKGLDVTVGDQLARVDSRALSNVMEAIDWVKSADISRNWFNGQVTVKIIPRVPVALFSSLGKPQLALDASGKEFEAPGAIPEGLPNVSAASVASGLVAIEVFTQMPKSFSKDIDRLTALSPTNISVYGKFGNQRLQIIWGDGEEASLKIKVVNLLLDRPENKSIRLIDVSAPHAPIVK